MGVPSPTPGQSCVLVEQRDELIRTGGWDEKDEPGDPVPDGPARESVASFPSSP
jgi:hypothetical protein